MHINRLDGNPFSVIPALVGLSTMYNIYRAKLYPSVSALRITNLIICNGNYANFKFALKIKNNS